MHSAIKTLCYIFNVLIKAFRFLLTSVLNISAKTYCYSSKLFYLQLQLKKEWEDMGHKKPNILEKDYERALQKIATRLVDVT